MYNIYVTENYDDEDAPFTYQAQIRDEDVSNTDSLTDWLNGTLVNLYLEDYNSQYTSEEDIVGEYSFATVSKELLKDFYKMINRPGVYPNGTVYIYGKGCTYIFNWDLYKEPYYKDVQKKVQNS